MGLNLSRDAYDTTRVASIIKDSEFAFSASWQECNRTIRELDFELNKHILLISNDIKLKDYSEPIKYVAIDGTRDIIEGHTHARLFAGAFAVGGVFDGKVDITNIEKGCAYSIVSLPYKILTSGNDYITESAGTITNLLMLLSEIFVAYSYALRDVNVIMLDRPLCGTLANTRTKISSTNSILRKYGAKELKTNTDLDDFMPMFEDICKRLFIESMAEPLKIDNQSISSEDLMYLSRVGMEKLFQLCLEKNIDLIGLTKTTNDCSFLRLLITLNALQDKDTSKIRKILLQSDDCRTIEYWSEPYHELVCTREYDTALMTSMVDEKKELLSLGGGGYAPPKKIVRSYMSFGMKERGGFVFAIERLVLNDEKPPIKELPNSFEIYLFEKNENLKQQNIYSLLKNMCTGAFPESLYYPLPLALAHRFAKSNFDYIRPRLKSSSRVFGSDIGYNDIKLRFT